MLVASGKGPHATMNHNLFAPRKVLMHKQTHVVLLALAPPQKNLFESFYLNELSALGITFDIWHLTGLFPEIAPKPTDVDCIKIDGLSAFNDALSTHSGKLFFLLFNFDRRTAEVFRRLRRHGKRLVYFSMGVMPSAGPRPSSRSFSRVMKGLLHRAFSARHRLFYGAEFDIVCYAGVYARNRARAKQDYISMNLPDWEVASQLNQSATDASHASVQGHTPYIVFLDNYIAFHPDLALLGIVKRIDSASYTRRLSKVFDTVEAQHGCPVVIAAHPKAQYPTGYFGDRRIVQGDTATLVQGCRAVLNHYSLSASYAVIFRKPICFIACSEFKNPSYGYEIALPIMRGWCQALKMPLIDLDNPPAALDWPDVEEPLYARYLQEYVTARSDGRRNADILANMILDYGRDGDK